MDSKQRGLVSVSLATLALSAASYGCGSGSSSAVGDDATDDKKETTRDIAPAEPAEPTAGADMEEPAPPASGASAVEPDLGLLGSSHARSHMDIFCDGKGDAEALPEDPRTLIRPGFNEGKAVAFNAYFQDCQGAPGPATCGEYRARREAGRQLAQMDLSANVFGIALPAGLYANAWKSWDGANLSERPANFDEQARERYGMPKAPFHNPYPLPGEKPNETDGGSGELPLGLRQLRGEDGRWTGTISMTCEICHSGGLLALEENGGSSYVPGMGANTADLQLLFTDMVAPMPVGMNDSPGVTNAMGLSGLIVTMFDQDTMGTRIDTVLLMQIPGNTSGAGDTKSPPWWNTSHRPRKFWDAGFSMDAARMDSAILNIPSAVEGAIANSHAFNQRLRDKIESDSLLLQTYVESLESPVYPWAIDEELAAQGSILFHARDLWADGANPDIPRPPSNGSCAGCHGVYAARFANDPAYLEDPRLIGVAGYITPLEMIRTDPERHKGFTRPLLEMLSTGWLSYPESSEGYIPLEEKSRAEERSDDYGIFEPGTRVKGACTWQGAVEGDATGYLAPPLHGIWATGPYLHNASLPDVWSVLSPDDRPAVWRRQTSSGEGTEHGYDTRAAAFDQERLGWKFERLVCGEGSASDGKEYVSCEPGEDPTHPYQVISNFMSNWTGSLNSIGYQVRQPTSRDKVELRKIFNTYRFAKSNGGHDFTRSLSDPERRAIVEYLKTL